MSPTLSPEHSSAPGNPRFFKNYIVLLGILYYKLVNIYCQVFREFLHGETVLPR